MNIIIKNKTLLLFRRYFDKYLIIALKMDYPFANILKLAYKFDNFALEVHF